VLKMQGAMRKIVATRHRTTCLGHHRPSRSRNAPPGGPREVETSDDEAHELQARIVALQGSNDELQSHNAVLTSTNTALTDRNNSLQQKNDELVSTNDRLAKETRMQQLSSRRRTEILQAADTINHMWTAWRESTHNSIMFEPDQLVAQGVVNCDRPAAEVVHTVEGLSRMLRLRRGALALG